MDILPGIRPKSWWEEFWEDPLCDYGEPGKRLLHFALELYKNFKTQGQQPRAIDIGSGNGRYAIPLARMGYETDALELASSGVKRIREAARESSVTVNAIQEDFVKVWSKEKDYDVVLSAGLVEETDPVHHRNILQGYSNWTKVEGHLLLKYCLEIRGRGQLIDEKLIPKFFSDRGWKILYTVEEKEMHPSRARYAEEDGIDSAVRVGTFIAQKNKPVGLSA